MTSCACSTLHIFRITCLPLSLQFYPDCNCRERVDCLVHVTGECRPRAGLKHAGLTLPDESKLVANWPAAPSSVVFPYYDGNRKDLFSLVQVRLPLQGFPSFFLFTNKCLGSGRWRVSRQLGPWISRNLNIIQDLHQ